MDLVGIDWAIIIGFFSISLFIGIFVSKRAGSSSSEFFLSGRNMPWWLLGVSMVATTFSTDTPNLVTDIVRNNGVSGNWVWWAFLITGLLTVFVYAKLWRKSNVKTDIEFLHGYMLGLIKSTDFLELIYSNHNIYNNTGAPKNAVSIQTFYESSHFLIHQNI